MSHFNICQQERFYETFHIKVEVLLEVKGSNLTFGSVQMCPL